jgi:hypothetical protein
MMSKLCLAALLVTAALSADPLINFGPGGSNTSAPAGGIAGWDVSVTPDSTLWVSIVDTQIVAESNPIGFYTDLFGFFGGPTDNLFLPASGNYTGPFNLLNGTGLGYYTIDSAAPFGAVDLLSIEVDYYLLDGDPFTCTDCSVVGSNFVTLDAAVSVPAPEPTGSMLLLAALAAASILKLRVWGGRPRPRRTPWSGFPAICIVLK